MTRAEKGRTATSAGVDVEKSERLGSAGAAAVENGMAGPQKVKSKITVDPAIPHTVHTQSC